MLNIFARPSSSPPSPGTTPDEAALLASSSLPDPSGLRQQLSAFQEQLGAAVARGDALDQQPRQRTFLEQQALAERIPRLHAQIEALKSQIVVAEKRRAAFVALVGLLGDTDAAIAAHTADLYARVMEATPAERGERMQALDALLRLRASLATALASVSNARRFRRAPADPLDVLQRDLRSHADAIDRLRSPGMPRAPIAWPAGAHELINALKGGRA